MGKPYNLFTKDEIDKIAGSDTRPSFEEWYKTVPSDRNDTSNYNLRRAYDLAPMEQLEKWRTATPEQLNDENYHLKSMYFDPKTGIGEFMKSKNHPTLRGELDWYRGDSEEARDFRNKYDLDTSGEYYRYIPKKQQSASSVQPAAQFDVTRDQYGNVYTNGKNTPAKVSNPSAVPVVEPQRRPIRSTEELAAAMSYTSPEEEERLRKASVTNQRIMAVADALRHIGNIANTVDYSPSQQFNQPWAEERARYERGKALRDAANYKYMSYEQAKAAQEQRARQLEAELAYKREKDAAAAQATKDYRDALLKDRADRWREQLSQKKENDDRNYELKKNTDAWRKEQGQQRISISASKSGGGRKSSGRRAGSGGGKYWLTDENGKVHYYPNKTMWEQGIAEYGVNISQDRSVPNGVDSYGKPKNKTVQRKAAEIGGQMARRAKARNAKGNGGGQRSNRSGFFNS